MLSLWNANSAKPQKWYQMPLDGCVSSTGKPYRITMKKGTVNKLLINFVGGGLSWNEETAARPVSIGAMLKKKEFFYISDALSIQLKFMNIGILNERDKRNPFHDWYVLTIPYTSGDFHIGNNEYSYQSMKGENKILYHHGNKNVSAALAVLKKFFPQTPDVLFIAGQSAGGYGCLAHSPKIKELYRNCNNIIVYSEVSHLHSSLWPEIAKNVWQVRPDLMAYIKSDDLIADLFRYVRDHMPPSTQFLHLNSVWDKELVEMMHKMNHGKKQVNSQARKEFHDTLLDTVRVLKSEIPSYAYYLTDYRKNQKDGTTPHMFSGSPKLLYSEMQDGMSLANWFFQAIEGNPIDVGTKFVEEAGGMEN